MEHNHRRKTRKTHRSYEINYNSGAGWSSAKEWRQIIERRYRHEVKQLIHKERYDEIEPYNKRYKLDYYLAMY